MGIQFIWDSSYSVGRDDIDRQHKQIFEMANSLPEVMDRETWKRSVMALYKHTREHFTAEEQMMREIGYPGLPEHRTLHEEMIGKLNEVSAQPLSCESAAYSFKKMLYTWIIDHILNRDMDYFRFVQKCAN
jgi:hemerythrin